MGVRDFNLPWIQSAIDLINTREIPGSRSNPTIMEWAKNLGGWIKNFYKNDDIPWCGLFVAHCLQDNNIHINIQNPLSARAWGEFGLKTTPRYGAIMVFSRTGGGHVGFYVSEDDETYHILGGNQSNSVNITRVAKNRFLECRWPPEYEFNVNAFNRIHKEFDGGISINEE